MSLVALTCVLLPSNSVLALIVKLESPGSLMLSAGVSREKVASALEQSDCKFNRGYSINRKSTLHFSGNELSVLAMIKRLGEIEGMIVYVSVIKLDQGSDWHVLHDTYQSTFHIVLNRDSKNINFDKLDFPVLPNFTERWRVRTLSDDDLVDLDAR